MTDLAGAVQTAIFNKLNAVPGLPQVVSSVPIGADDAPIFPFTLLGDDNVTEQGGKGSRLEQHIFSIHVAMQSTTVLVVRAAQELVRAALHEQPISAAGAILSNPILQDSHTPLMADGATFVGHQTFMIWAQPGS